VKALRNAVAMAARFVQSDALQRLPEEIAASTVGQS
jgi:hypothetical protein